MVHFNYTKELKQLNSDNAIKGPVQTKLKDILPMLTRESLSKIASHQSVAGRSKMKKEELADSLTGLIPNGEALKIPLLMAEPKEWELFARLAESPPVQDDGLYPGRYLFLMSRGLLFSFYDKGRDQLVYLVPEELKTAYRGLQLTSFPEERERCQLVLRYIEAVVNLYGICPIDQMFEIFNGQNERQLDEAEFMRLFYWVSRRARVWYVEDGNFVSEHFDLSNEAEKEELLERVQNKPYYIPKREEFLKYADSFYYERTPQLEALHHYIDHNLCKDKRLTESLVDDIQLHCSMEASMQDILYEFERRQIEFNTMAQAQAAIRLITDVYNHTRIWSNRGHTPAELGQISRGNVPFGQQVIAVKIGRNDPCPCGSGKKYKKCCSK